MSESANAGPVSVETSAPEATESSEGGEIAGGAPASGEQVAALADAAKNGTPQEKVVAKKMLRELKIKFNGKDYTEKLPFEIEDKPEYVEYMKKQLQMSKMAQTKNQEYSQLEKEVKVFIDDLRKNPMKALSNPNVGVDVKELARQVIESEIENSKKSPEQIAKEKVETELAELKSKYDQEKEEAKVREFERIREQEYVRYDTAISTALEKSELPKSPYVVKKMADYMLLGLQNGYDVTADDVLPLVQEEIQNDIKQMFAAMPDEVLESFIGKDNIGRMRKKAVAKAKAAPVTAQQIKDVGAPVAKKAPTTPEKKLNYKDFFKF